MSYILRTHIKKKYLIYGLKSVYGIGTHLSGKICKSLGFHRTFLLRDISDEQIFLINQSSEEWNLPLKGELKKKLKHTVDKLVSLKTVRGIRNRQGLPVRGQRTHTNARTQKKLKQIRN